MGRVLGEKKKSGWRPRRTMMFLSWGAEEYSLCGSREFVEQYEIELRERDPLLTSILISAWWAQSWSPHLHQPLQILSQELLKMLPALLMIMKVITSFGRTGLKLEKTSHQKCPPLLGLAVTMQHFFSTQGSLNSLNY